MYRYAYSAEVGEELDDDEAPLTGKTQEGDVSLVKQEKKERSVEDTDDFDLENSSEEDKRE